MIENMRMNTNSIKQTNVEKDRYQSECKVIPIHDSDDEDMAEVMDEDMGLGFDLDLLNLFYIVLVALLFVVIYPIIYILFFWARFKMHLSNLYHSFWKKFSK